MAADVLAYFGLLARGGLVAAGIGLPASFLVVFHGIVFWFLIQAFGASKQYRTNELVRRLEFEAKSAARLTFTSSADAGRSR